MNSRLNKTASCRVWAGLAVAFCSVLAPRLAQAQNSPPTASLGINDHNFWQTEAMQDVVFAKYAESGTKFVRTGAFWSSMETSKGVYNPVYVARMDHFFQKATEAGIRVLLISAYAPAWANGGNTGGGWAPTNDEDFADFCEYLMRRYAPYKNAAGQHTLEAMELWNEPDLADIYFKPFKRNSAEGATKYGQMVVAAGGRLKKVRATIDARDILVVAPVVADVHSTCYYPWMDSFYAVPGVTDCYDVFSWHSYWQSSGTSWLPPELPAAFNTTNQRQGVMGKLTAPLKGEIWEKMVAHGDDKKPNWLTEVGGAARSDTPEHKSSLLSLDEQKKHLQDVVDTLYSGKITNLRRVYWYTFFDGPSQKGDQQVYGLMALTANNPVLYEGTENFLTGKLTPKPAYQTYKDAPKTGPITGTPPVVAPPKVTTVNAPQPPAPKPAVATPALVPVTALATDVAAHAGQGLGQATFSGTPSWKGLFQIAKGVQPNSDTEFSFWMKGSGTMRLKISPGDWSSVLVSKDFTATPVWTKYTLPLFNTGDRNALVYCFQDAGQVAGTMYLDDCFLGAIGGENKLANPGFEDGTTGWNPGPMYSILKTP